MKFKIKGIEETMRKARQEVERVKLQTLLKESANLVQKLSDATPVDTGLASKSWRMILSGRRVTIVNDVPYIAELNRGSSQQAPAFFIEKIVLENHNVVPIGAIASYR